MKKAIFSLAILLVFSSSLAFWGPANAANGTLSLSQSSVSLNVGQTATVTIYLSGNEVANVTSITNTAVVSANISGSVLSIYGIGTGSSTVGVCSNNQNCAYVYVNVSGYGNYYGNYGNVILSQNSVSLSVGQSMAVSVYAYGPSNNYFYVSNNSNQSVVSTSLSGSTLNLYALASGNASISVCAGNLGYGNCASLYVTVSGAGTGYGNVILSQNNVALTTGQSTSVSIYAYGNVTAYYFVSSNSNATVATANISGSTLTVYGQNSGSTNITVCAGNISYGNCATLYVVVTSGSGSGSLALSPNALTLNIGQTATVIAYNNYYAGLAISSNSNSAVASAYVSSNNQINVYGNSSGSTNIYVCSLNNYQCASIYVTVSGYNYGYGNYYPSNFYFGSVNPPQGYVGQYYNYALMVSGGYTPYSFTLNSGMLPYGLTMSGSGVISGTPTQSGSYVFTVRVSDNLLRSLTSSTITINVSGGNYSGSCQYYPYYGNCPGQVAGASIYNSGTLISENGTIYIVYKSSKTGFANFSAFKGLGYSANNVLYISASGLIDSGYIVNSANVAHPWGTWVKSGGTVYFMHETGLIPVPSHEIFINNGGQDALVVPASSRDFQKQILPLMDFNDLRLK